MRQAAIPDVGYRNPAAAALGVEVLTLAALRERAAPGHHLVRPQRPAFHLLFLVTAGTGVHTVDFTRHPLDVGSVVWVRPGQVQQFEPGSRLDGPLVLFQPGFPPPGTPADTPFGPACWRLTAQDRLLGELGMQHLASEYAALTHAPATGAAPLLAHLLAAVLHRLARSGSGADERPGSEAFLRFRDAVERDFASGRRVADYARALGYSTRTLARASRQATGAGPKELLDRRVVLEAQRLLAHTDLPAARIGERLGFPDATNFSKFFRHRTGTTPGAFRAGTRDPGA